MEYAEKLLFVVSLAYFKIIYEWTGLFVLPHFAAFNILWLALSGWQCVRIFRLLSAPITGFITIIFLFQNTFVLYNYMHGQHAGLGIFLALLALQAYLAGFKTRVKSHFSHQL